MEKGETQVSKLRSGMVDYATDRIREIIHTEDLSEVEAFELVGEVVAALARRYAEDRRSLSEERES